MTQPSSLPNWPTAYPATHAQAVFKSQLDDFLVTELPETQPCGEGEHIWLWVEKRGSNSAWVAQQLADYAGVQLMDVGLAGLKDRHGITQQYFSVYFPKGAEPDFLALKSDEFTVLSQARHNKKLRRGDLLGNRFTLVLREVQGDKSAIEANLHSIQQHGFPNYFGEQRFGHQGNNIEQGRAMLMREIRVRSRNKKSLYLSAVRSLLFNEVLAKRIRLGHWNVLQAGDIADAQQLPTGPMWGRGRLATTDAVLSLESELSEEYADLCLGLEHAGLTQERRSLVGLAQDLSWQWLADNQLQLNFSLAAGHYATSLIKEILQVQEQVADE